MPLDQDSVSERLRRWTRNPLGSARRGSNPLAVELLVVWQGSAAQVGRARPFGLRIPEQSSMPSPRRRV